MAIGILGIMLFVMTTAAGLGYGAFLLWKKREENKLPTYWGHSTHKTKSKNKF